MSKVSVSVVIAAHNEAADITECIASVAWADQVLVVENDSTDDTIELAKAAGAEVFSHPFQSIGRQRNAAIERARHEWILVLDADERATPEVAAALEKEMSHPRTDAYRLRMRNRFLGREIRYGGWGNDWQLRFFRRALRYDERPVHEHVMYSGATIDLATPLWHTPYANLDEYFGKLRSYSRWWGEQHAARGRKARFSDLTLRPVLRFFSMFVLKGGWRDGMHGAVVAALAAVSVAAKYAQLWARNREALAQREK